MFRSLAIFTLILALTQASAKEVSIQANRVATQKMTGKITLSGPSVRSATSGYYSGDGGLWSEPVDSLEVTDAQGEIKAELYLLPTMEKLNNEDLIDFIQISFDGKRSTGHALNFRVVIQPLQFKKGVYPKASRYPFNTEVKHETQIDEEGIPRELSRVSVAKNGFDLSINSSGFGSSSTTIKIDEIFFDSNTGKLVTLNFSFAGGSSNYGYQGTVELK